MEFLVLGSLEVRADNGLAVPIAGRQPRTLLAVLLLDANQPVSADRIAIALWGEEAPADAVKAVRVVVSRLRRALDDGVLTTSEAGYRLSVKPGELDSDRFVAQVEQAVGALETNDPFSANRLLSEALSLWRGPAFADVAFEPFAQAAVARLDEQRLMALELRVEAELQLGRADEAVAELKRLVTDHPLRERLHSQLMLALYRTGRQADALDVYRRFRASLLDELGLEPGAELRALEEAILRQDPSLDNGAAVAAVGPSDMQVSRRAFRRSRPAAALMALGTVTGVVAGMLMISDREGRNSGNATMLGSPQVEAEALESPWVDAEAVEAKLFENEVAEVCERVNESFRAHKREITRLRRELRAARTIIRQRDAILDTTRTTVTRGGHDLAKLESLEPPADARPTYSRTIGAWERNLKHNLRYQARLTRASNRRQLEAAIDPYTEARSEIARNLVVVKAGLQRMGGSGCDIELYVPERVPLPPLPTPTAEAAPEENSAPVPEGEPEASPYDRPDVAPEATPGLR
jgi:DNA-binding SARP family transcriptional activator